MLTLQNRSHPNQMILSLRTLSCVILCTSALAVVSSLMLAQFTEMVYE